MMDGEFLHILGVPNFANYEASAAILKVNKDGDQISYVSIAEERLTRIKHAYTFPLLSIQYCLDAMGLETLDSIDYIATDYARLPRWINSGPGYRKLEHDYIKLQLKFPRERILVVDHHSAHAAAAFYLSGFDEAAVLVIDGLGSRLNTQSLFHMTHERTREIERGSSWGIGRLYSMVTGGILPYGSEMGYGKVMGLAPYGEKHPGPVLYFESRDDGMQTDYSAFMTRFPIPRLVDEHVRRCEDRHRVTEPYPSRAAFDVQQECERQVIRMAQYAHEKTGSEYLCLAGGVALNGAANLRILEQTPIKRLWIQPGASDTGIPLGLTLWAYYNVLRPSDEPTRIAMKHAYTGRPYERREIEDVLSHFNIESQPCSPSDFAAHVASGSVGAWFEGASEFGPRALGHRSIVADPRQSATKDHLNAAVKFRESYRPYAPSILLEHVSEWLELDGESPFMLLLPRVREDKRAVVPAVTHVDHTTRPQTVTEEQGQYQLMIKAFYELTGVPMVLNTSFNVNREPIVETPIDALICALGTGVDVLYLQGRLIDCNASRNPTLLRRLLAHRAEQLESARQRAKDRLLVSFDPVERDRYLEEENKIATWYRDYRAKYELEKAMLAWRQTKERVLIAGTRGHTKALYLYIPEFPGIQVVGFVAFDDLYGERDGFTGVYPEVGLENVSWSDVDVVLISSHEHQVEISDAIRKSNATIRVFEIYDDACDSLAIILPDRWPVVNPLEAHAKGLRFAPRRLITAGNIDFDDRAEVATLADRYAVIVTYHYCHPENAARPGMRGVTPSDLDVQLEQLGREFQFVTISDLLNPALQLPPAVAVLTFDDGLRDFTHAAPVLARHGVRATIYCASSPLQQHRLLDVHRIHLLHNQLGIDRFQKDFEIRLDRVDVPFQRDSHTALGVTAAYPYDDEATRRFKLALNYELPYEIVSPILQSMVADVLGDESSLAQTLYLGQDDLRELQRAGHDIGIHTHTHPILSRLSEARQRDDLSTAARYFRDSLGLTAIHVAYPYGNRGTWNHLTRKVVKDLGFIGAVTMERRVATPQDLNVRWEIPRFDVRDLFDANNTLRVSAIEAVFSGE